MLFAGKSRICFGLCIVMCLAGCDTQSLFDRSAQGDMNASFPAEWEPPQIVHGAGPIVRRATVYTHFVDGEDPNQMAAFVSDPDVLTYMRERLHEYGVEDLQVVPSTPVTSDAVKSDSALADFLQTETSLAGGLETLHVFFLKPGQDARDFSDKTLCGPGASGYRGSVYRTTNGHQEAIVPVLFAVIGACAADLTSFYSPTHIYTHELAESLTDPLGLSAGRAFGLEVDGYRLLNAPYRNFEEYIARGTEYVPEKGGHNISDICNVPDIFPPYFLKGWRLARIWSNAAARAGQDPCQPHTTSLPYTNTAFLFPDDPRRIMWFASQPYLVRSEPTFTIEAQTYQDDWPSTKSTRVMVSVSSYPDLTDLVPVDPEWISGKYVEIGKPFRIEIKVDDNLFRDRPSLLVLKTTTVADGTSEVEQRLAVVGTRGILMHRCR